MSQIESLELNKIERLVNEGKFDAALKKMNQFEEGGEISLQDKVSFNLLKCDILNQQSLYEDSLQLAENTYKESLGLGKSLLTIDCLNLMAYSLMQQNKTDKAVLLLNQGEELLKTITQENLKDYKKREADINFYKGFIFHPWVSQESDLNLALKYLEQSIAIHKKYNDENERVDCLLGISSIFAMKGEFKKSFKIIERALIQAKKNKRKQAIAWGLNIKGILHNFKGEIDKSVELYQQSISLFKELNNYIMVANLFNNLGGIFKSKGELDQALSYLEEALEIATNLNMLRDAANFYDFLIQILIEKGDINRAEEYLSEFEKIDKKLNRKDTHYVFLFDKALVLKTSSRVINRGKAEELFKQVLDMGPQIDTKISALINICDLLLIELKTTNNLEVLEEINDRIEQMFNIAEKTGSYEVLAESYLLQAKLALISLELEEARKLLTQGQRIAEKFGLQELAMKISKEHDDLLKELSKWENFRESKVPLQDRMDLSRLNEQIEGMIKKRLIDIPILPEEEPMLLLILSEGGLPVFSQYFVEDQSIEDHVFGGFLTAINSFINEIFSEGLDRVIFGDHTILVNALAPFFICYVFKGQSYSANLKIKVFIEGIQNDKEIWESFESFYKRNQEIQLKDVPTLKPLIQGVFIATK
ncbi:MAG: tetratricopeptide repeat protein [Promethearchaeota archaeon]|jgi:tetratricopeptide (TPR) repeat protein